MNIDICFQLQDNDDQENATALVDLRQKINEKKSQQNGNKRSPSIVDELNDIMDKKHDEDALDFEAEDGECAEEKEEKAAATQVPGNKTKKDADGEIEVSSMSVGFVFTKNFLILCR